MSRDNSVCLAVDFGAGSGRVIAGRPSPGGELLLDEVHRFDNSPVRLGPTLHWDFPMLYAQMCRGIRKAAERGYRVASVGIDTWGVDFGLLTPVGALAGLPLCYRDGHTAGLPEQMWPGRDGRVARYRRSGIWPNAINTLYQLAALARREPGLLAAADRLLFMPDLFGYFLTGSATTERTIASTSEMLVAGAGEWDRPLIDELGLPQRLFGPIVEPGTVKGAFLPEVARSLGLEPGAVLVAVGSHDTASAVGASQAAPGTRQAFLSSGTWSLLGMALTAPVCTPEALDQGYTNEAGVDGATCLLQNIPGLWILQNLVKKWETQGRFEGYDRLTEQAEASAVDSLIDVDHPAFTAPDDMEAAITDYCREHDCQAPRTPGDYARVALRSLARRYTKAVEGLNALLPEEQRPLGVNIVGGGSRNGYLNRLTAEATGLPVTAGPVEATAIGNIAVQLQTLKEQGITL